ncbi:restriction endonuclease subunit S [Luteimonas vadosa]|uniref:Type I restriction modification DNA specificity domain-containing protein n=1 Tax=Luteimonas vadosa TaxID=1165507 RepID=A0ABP9DZM3_9GAMM
MTDELPPGWELATVGDVAHFVRGVTYSKEHAKKAPAPGLVGILRATNIGDGLNFDDLVFVPERFVSDEQIVRDGDVVLAMSSGSKSVVGKAAIARSPQRCGFGAFCGVIRPSQAIVPSLLAYYFQTKAYRNAVSEVSKGSNINNLKAGHILERPLPIPPAGEQQRIASKIDELFSRIDEGERALERVSILVERYRQAVLKAAVTGELTRAWREKNKDTLESGVALLARILTARREAWEKAELEKMKAKGIKPANDKWKEKYKEPAAPDTAGLPDLAQGWTWASLDQIAAPEKYAVTDGPFGSNLKTEHYTDSGPRVVRLQNIKDGVFSDVHAHISRAHFDRLKKHHIFAGDLLISALGESLPRVCLVPPDLGPAIVKADCVRFKTSPLVVSECVMAFLNSPPSRKRTKTIIHGVGRPRLNLKEIRALVVPVPPEAEQQAIVDQIRTQVGSVEQLLAETLRFAAQVAAVRQSTLSQAFRGRLVSQDPVDEPASLLLERIAAERGANTSAPKSGRKKKTTA